MKVSNKKIVVVVLLIIELTSCYLMYQSSKKEVNLDKVSYQENIPNNLFAMYIKNEDTGEYDEVTDTNIFPDGYKLNSTKTGCIDNKGNLIENILNYKNGKVAVKSNKTVFCYLYFDIDNSVYQKVGNDYKNSNGALLLSETESDEYPVYYYSGNITNNNILYANFCWKMVRTTETGGVKLIYNGVPDTTEDETLTCDNTGDESQIGTSAYNSNINSLAYFGYMYNTIYTVNSKNLLSNLKVMENDYNNNLYYADTAIWNEETSQYELSNSDGSEVTTYVWADSYRDLIGKYTCNNATSLKCSTVSYVANGGSYWKQFYYLSEGKDYDDYKIKLATSVTNNEDGTYTLVEPIEISKAEYAKNYENYKGYYYCKDLVSNLCSDMYYSTSAAAHQLTGYNMANVYKYGNSFTYENGKYTLVDTKEFWNWEENYNQINNNHYTCFNTTGECENVYYIYYSYNTSAAYITLSNGKNITDALNEMLYAEDVNTTDSTIKTYIDEWYENNIVDVLDSNNILYTSYLENTIWCNSREIKDVGGWDSNGGDTTKQLSLTSNSLDCPNKTDQFTLKVEAGGIEGYGNNSLDYPIGLITYKEASLGGITSLYGNYTYLRTESSYWLLGMQGFYGYAGGLSVGAEGRFYGYYGDTSYGVRPSVSLSNKIEVTSGDGSVNNPYQVTLFS